MIRRLLHPDIIFYFLLILVAVGGLLFSIVWPRTEGFYAFIVLAAFSGLGVVSYIYYAKNHRKHLACPAGSNCNVVVNSRYSKFLGISLEYFGALYYITIVVSYALLLIIPQIRDGRFSSFLFAITATAFLFSLYLLFVQAFILRQWCIWCLMSAILSISIFMTSLFGVPMASVFFVKITTFLLFVEALGFVLGLGGATTALFLFFRFLRNDLKIDDKEAQKLHELSEFVWLGLALIFVSFLAQYVAQPDIFTKSDVFLAQIPAFIVTVFSGAVLTLLFAPLVSMLPFYTDSPQEENKRPLLASIRKKTIMTGSVSISSWYFAFVLIFVPHHYTLSALLFSYVVLLIVAVLIGIILNKKLS